MEITSIDFIIII